MRKMILVLMLLLGLAALDSRLTPAPQAAQMDGVRQIAGAWNSEWGTVVLNVTGVQGNLVQLSGFWRQGPHKTGQITQGTYDAYSGQLNFSYYQPWNGMQGTAFFTMSPDGTTLMGGYEQPDSRGNWQLSR
jgi:hypothetical protein